MATNNKNELEAKSSQKEGKVTAVQPKEEKKRWTISRCRKVANRFNSEAEWAKGAPSSYKSAQAHGWTQEIVNSLKSKSTSSPKTNVKKAA